jgi:hypothetical protein
MKKTFTITIDDADDIEMFQHHVDGPSYYSALWEISQMIFRPARKHGYGEPKLDKLLEDSGEAAEMVSLLEDKFYEILSDRGVEL